MRSRINRRWLPFKTIQLNDILDNGWKTWPFALRRARRELSVPLSAPFWEMRPKSINYSKTWLTMHWNTTLKKPIQTFMFMGKPSSKAPSTRLQWLTMELALNPHFLSKFSSHSNVYIIRRNTVAVALVWRFAKKSWSAMAAKSRWKAPLAREANSSSACQPEFIGNSCNPKSRIGIYHSVYRGTSCDRR